MSPHRHNDITLNQNPNNTDVGGPGGHEGGAGCPIVRLYSAFETRDALVLELELMSRSDLFDELSTTGVLREGKTAAIVHQVGKFNGLSYWKTDRQGDILLAWSGPFQATEPSHHTQFPGTLQPYVTHNTQPHQNQTTGGTGRGVLRAAPHCAPGREALQHHLPHPGGWMGAHIYGSGFGH